MLVEGSPSFPFLSALLLLPLAGILFLLPINARYRTNIQNGTLWIQAFTFFAVLGVVFLFILNTGITDKATMASFLGRASDFQFVENHSWMSTCFLNFSFGVDLTAVVLLLLVTGTFPFATVLTFKENTKNPRLQAIILLSIEGSLMASLCSLNVLFLLLFSDLAYFLMFMIFPSVSFISLKERFFCSAILLIIFLAKAFDSGSFFLSDFSRSLSSPVLQTIFLLALLFRRSPFELPTTSSLAPRFLDLIPLFIGDMFFSIRLLKITFNPAALPVFYIFLGMIGLQYFLRRRDFMFLISHITACLIYVDLFFSENTTASLCFLINNILGSAALIYLSQKPTSSVQIFLHLNLKTLPFSVGFIGHVLVLQSLQTTKNMFFAMVYLSAIFFLFGIPVGRIEKQERILP